MGWSQVHLTLVWPWLCVHHALRWPHTWTWLLEVAVPTDAGLSPPVLWGGSASILPSGGASSSDSFSVLGSERTSGTWLLEVEFLIDQGLPQVPQLCKECVSSV